MLTLELLVVEKFLLGLVVEFIDGDQFLHGVVVFGHFNQILFFGDVFELFVLLVEFLHFVIEHLNLSHTAGSSSEPVHSTFVLEMEVNLEDLGGVLQKTNEKIISMLVEINVR